MMRSQIEQKKALSSSMSRHPGGSHWTLSQPMQTMLLVTRAKRNGQAIVRSRSVEPSRNSFLNGLGLARVTNNIVCIGCDSVQWLPPGWRELLDDSAFFCSLCDRIILARGLR